MLNVNDFICRTLDCNLKLTIDYTFDYIFDCFNNRLIENIHMIAPLIELLISPLIAYMMGDQSIWSPSLTDDVR